MINPAQYQQVLQKMPDPQLMQLLKRPDKIPSQFVIQEINRRKQMRQAEQARKQQVANAVAMQQQPPQQPIGMRDGGEPDENVGSAKEVLAMELRFQKEFNKPVGDEKSPPFYEGMSDVFFNEKGVPKKVSGAMEMTKAINEGFVFTRDDADKFPAPPISREEKIFKRSNNILEAYGRGGGALLQDADERAKNYIKELEALNKLSPNYNPIISSASGMTRTLVPRSETADGLLDRLAGGYDIKVEYDPSKNENLPKPKPKMAEGGITAMGMSSGGNRRSGYRSYPMQSGIDFGIEYPDSFSPSFLNRADTPYYVSRRARKKGMGFIPLYERSEQGRQVPTRRGGVRTILPYQRGTGPYQVGDPNIASQGRPFGVTPEVTTPDGKTFTPVATSSEDPDDLGNFPEVVLDDSGIKSVNNQTTSENEKIVVTEEPKLTEKMDETPNNFFANSLDAINKQIKETNNKFGVEQLQKGKEGLLQFNELSEAFKGLEEKGKKRVTDFNADSKALLDERRKLISKLEAGGRSPSSIVYESLINMGLNLMASPEANFTQALGQAGQAGFATFQNLRKEEKERVKDLHKMSYDLAVKEFEHKQKADEIANAYDLKVLDGKSVLLNAKLQMAEQERKGVKTAADIGFMGDQIRQGDLKIALQSAQNDIQMFNANINKFKAENDAIYKNQLTELEKIKVDSNKSIFNRIFDVESKNPDNKDESDVLNSTITRYALTQADSVKDENVKKDLIEKAIPTLFGSFDPEQARLDEEYTRNFIMQANKIIDSLVKAEGGLTITEEKLDEILASYGQK